MPEITGAGEGERYADILKIEGAVVKYGLNTGEIQGMLPIHGMILRQNICQHTK